MSGPVRRVLLALLVATTGTVVLAGVQRLVEGLIDGPHYLAACFVGALGSCLWLAKPARRLYSSWLGVSWKV